MIFDSKVNETLQLLWGWYIIKTRTMVCFKEDVCKMSDIYVECLVAAGRSKTSKMIVIGLAALTVVFAFVMLFVNAVALLPAVITGVAAYFVNVYSYVEYEYLYLDKEITVDKILAQSRRRRVATYSIDRMEVFAPVKSWHVDAFQSRDVKTFDYSAGEGQEPDGRYVMYYEGGARVLFNPSEEFVKALFNAAPRKVFRD